MSDDEKEPSNGKQLSSWRLRSPMVQNMIASICLAMTPGIYLAITLLGAGAGKTAATVVNSKVNVILYAIFFFVSIVAGPCVNFFGPKLCLAFGTTGYAMYVGGLWYIDAVNKPGFPLFSGAYLGVTAGFLWTACAYTSQAYGDERKKAWYIQMQLCFQSLGSMVGSAIAFGANYHKASAGGVSSGVYGAFIAIHLVAGLIALLLIVDPKTVTRNDGTHLAVFPRPSLRGEWEGLKEMVRNPRVTIFTLAGFTFDLWLPPLGSWNSYTFSLRSRGLNALTFYLMQIIGGFIILFLASNPWIKTRKSRGLAVLVWVLIIQVAGYGLWIGYLVDTKPNRAVTGPALDWSMGAPWGKAYAVYMIMGLMATSMRNFVYYMNAVATNDPTKQARYAGFMHAMPQAGLCVAFGIETVKPKFLNEAIAYFAVTIFSILVCFVGVYYFLTETMWGKEANVIVPVKDAHELAIECEQPPASEVAEGTEITDSKDKSPGIVTVLKAA